MALVSLIIMEKIGLSDHETVDQIKENPYLQCFPMGLKAIIKKRCLMLVAKEEEQERQKNKKAKQDAGDKNDTADHKSRKTMAN